jgi:hypothetical protein
MQLLEDTFIIENLQILNEGRGTGPMKISGCFQRADEANNNKRIYSKPLLEREINKLSDAMSERRLMGELDHPQHDSVKLSNVSHLITGLSMKGKEVIGEAEILSTPSGKVAQALIEAGVKIGISSRGMGTVSENFDGTRNVNEDFRLITWDIVADPSTRGAYPDLTESTQIQEIIDRVLPEAQKVKNFTTLLKEELTVESTPAGREEGKEVGKEHASKQISGRRIPWVLQMKRGVAQKDRKPKAESEADKKKAQQEYHTSQQISSTQFVNFMRDKLMEMGGEFDTRGRRFGDRPTQQQRDKKTSAAAKKRAAKMKARLDKVRAEQAERRRERAERGERGWRPGDPGVTPESERDDSSTQILRFMRDKLMEAKRMSKSLQRAYRDTPLDRPGAKSSGKAPAGSVRMVQRGPGGSVTKNQLFKIGEVPTGQGWEKPQSST